jgi:hypothetical protein
MIPWPVALLTAFYCVVATLSAAMLWNIVRGASRQPLVWALAWLGVSGAAMCGLPLLRPWGRRMALLTSWLLIGATLAVAAGLVAAGKPALGLAVTFSTACHYLMVRYLKRPAVRAWFGE